MTDTSIESLIESFPLRVSNIETLYHGEKLFDVRIPLYIDDLVN
jgi:hypothetical protein